MTSALAGGRYSARVPDLLDGCGELVRRPGDQSDRCAGLSQRPREQPSHAPAAAGHQCDASMEIDASFTLPSIEGVW